MKVYILINLDLGWDNVIGVYNTRDKAMQFLKDCGYDTLEDASDNLYILHEKEVD